MAIALLNSHFACSVSECDAPKPPQHGMSAWLRYAFMCCDRQPVLRELHFALAEVTSLLIGAEQNQHFDSDFVQHQVWTAL